MSIMNFVCYSMQILVTNLKRSHLCWLLSCRLCLGDLCNFRNTWDDFNFSQLDISTSDNLNIPFVLYTIKNNDYKFYFPTNFKKRYIGRYFKIGENDCFTFIKEYFLKELNVNIEPIFKNYTSHTEAQTVFNKNLEFNFLEKNNFFKIEKDDLNVNDLLVISTLFGKHFAIYIGNNKIIHQPIFGFSKIENYCNFYRRHTVLAYRKKIW